VTAGAGAVPRVVAGPREIRAWCLYDFANSAFTTLVVTFLYATYFTQGMVGDEVRGTRLWSWGVSGSFLVVALLSPVIGARADAAGRRRPLVSLSLVCIACTAALAFVPPPHWGIALVLFGIANFAYETSGAIYNAYLPDLAAGDRIGRLSGYGWGLGYAGGLASLVLGLTLTGLPDGAGGWYLRPWLSTEAGWNLRATNLLVAAWFALFALPAFLRLRDRGSGRTARATAPFREVANTLRHLGRYRETGRFLVARLVYNDGLVTVFSFGGIYAAGTLGMSFGGIMLLGIWLNVVAGIGAATLGHLDDRLGGKTTVVLTLVVLIAGTLLGATATSRAVFWCAATAIGLMVGPNQAASRSLMGRFSPQAHRAEFFGFFALSGKLTAFLGPLVLGLITGWTGSQRWGMASVAAFLAVGLLLLAGLDEERAAREAAAVP
jgi:UMF1 family MFS transporter